MGRRSRELQQRRHLGAPTTEITAESLARRIRDGGYDNRLTDLADAINDRAQTLRDERNEQARRHLHVGCRVRILDNVKPLYLVGQVGEIHEIDHDHVIVCLDNPIGKFTDGHIQCTPTNLEPLSPQQP